MLDVVFCLRTDVVLSGLARLHAETLCSEFFCVGTPLCVFSLEARSLKDLQAVLDRFLLY